MSVKMSATKLIPDQPDAPKLKGPLPGPKAKAIVERDERSTSPSYTRDYPLVIDRGIGCVVEDPDGNVFLDFTAGIAVCATGHSHPAVVKAIQDQAARFLHMSGTDFYYATEANLAERLCKLSPTPGPNRVMFTNSGAESIEGALKLARFHTRRKQVIAFYGAFHGRTYGAMSLTASKNVQRRGFSPLVPGVTHVNFPNPYRFNGDDDACSDAAIDGIREVFKHKTAADEVAAIFVEPIQGEGGYIVPPVKFLRDLRALCTENGIMLVCDEIQSGMGRTGTMFCIERAGVAPDIVTLAKGLASGMPLGAIVAPEAIMDWPYGSHASTFGGNPVSCAASLATIDLLEAGLMKNAEKMGERLRERLNALKEKRDAIGDVRGLGLMTAIEFVKDRKKKTRDAETRNKVVQATFRRGLLMLGCGENALRFCPGLVVSEAQIDRAVGILDEAIEEVTGKGKS
jgi:4-aminobutyrate aminotransferase